LEGSDYFSAAGWEYGYNIIFICRNILDKYKKNRKSKKKTRGPDNIKGKDKRRSQNHSN